MSTYVNITRKQLESWLDDMGLGGWCAMKNTAGVYRIHVSNNVSIQISTGLKFDDESMDCGKASVKMKLVSRVTDDVLNKKAVGQSCFYRTKNWRDTWAEGVKRLWLEYERCSGFYERIALGRDSEPPAPEPKPEYVNDAGFPCDDPETYERRLGLIRKLWLAAANANQEWTKNFAESVGAWYKDNRSLTPKQTEIIKRKLKELGVK